MPNTSPGYAVSLRIKAPAGPATTTDLAGAVASAGGTYSRHRLEAALIMASPT